MADKKEGVKKWFISYCTLHSDGQNEFGCAIVHLHPLEVIQNYNNMISVGIKKHTLISWQELYDEDIKYATFSSY